MHQDDLQQLLRALNLPPLPTHGTGRASALIQIFREQLPEDWPLIFQQRSREWRHPASLAREPKKAIL
jgi:hypothetical protein